MKRLALLALLAAPLHAQIMQPIPFPGGTFHKSIITAIDWEGKPALLLVSFSGWDLSLFARFDPPAPGSWSFEIAAAAIFDSRACAQTFPAVAELSVCDDYPGRPFPPMNSSGVVVEIGLRVPLKHAQCFSQPPNTAPWFVNYVNGARRSPCPVYNGPEFFVLILRVI